MSNDVTGADHDRTVVAGLETEVTTQEPKTADKSAEPDETTTPSKGGGGTNKPDNWSNL